MDNFIDRITSRFSGQEVIKANAEAEALEMRKLKAQAEQTQTSLAQTQKTLAQYDACMQEMRKLGLRNAESAKAVAELIENAQVILKKIKDNDVVEKEDDTALIIAGVSEKLNNTNDKIIELSEKMASADDKVADVLNELRETMEKGSETINSAQNAQSSLKADLEGTIHKENVKVYRNVQASLMEEINKQTDALKDDIKNFKSFSKAVLILVIISLAVGLGNIGIIIAQLFGVF